ncbi:phage tail protein [Mesoterricola silvestris]|uniref:Tail Collar domain-containing protein n=1 Tax=Mesoterricola silvestris TaxID=2927979 RepID=A0AA48K8B4_9BACT|nr:tail fiber protein [Mesoterricola silvestris]BDU71960.1 tail Collar domain-containing protein [Mesoterricola silvestris]
MSDPFVAEIRMVGFTFAPTGWAQCNGQILPIAQNTALFSLVGTLYGGDGRSTFALPDLQGRVPLAADTGSYPVGSALGSEQTHLITQELPSHAHTLNAVAAAGTTTAPDAAFLAQANRQAGPVKRNIKLYGAGSPDAQMSAQEVVPAGNSAGHNNLQPYLTLQFVIALQGVFPPRS